MILRLLKIVPRETNTLILYSRVWSGLEKITDTVELDLKCQSGIVRQGNFSTYGKDNTVLKYLSDGPTRELEGNCWLCSEQS